MDDNYEMVPYKDLLELKKDIDDIRRSSSPELLDAVKTLNAHIIELLAIIKEAAKGMSETDGAGLKKISDKLDAISEQNEKIADGIVALSDALDTSQNQKSSNQWQEPELPRFAQPLQPPMQAMQNFNPMPPMQPSSLPAHSRERALPEMDTFSIPPPPQMQQGMPQFPLQQPKRGLFGKFRK